MPRRARGPPRAALRNGCGMGIWTNFWTLEAGPPNSRPQNFEIPQIVDDARVVSTWLSHVDTSHMGKNESENAKTNASSGSPEADAWTIIRTVCIRVQCGLWGRADHDSQKKPQEHRDNRNQRWPLMNACVRGVMEPVRAGDRSDVVGDGTGAAAANGSVGMPLDRSDSICSFVTCNQWARASTQQGRARRAAVQQCSGGGNKPYTAHSRTCGVPVRTTRLR